MADPATQFQPGGMGIGYSFQPSQYHPQAVNVPSQAGALWAQVGQTALEASKMLQNTAGINPEIRAQMKYAVDNYQQGQDAIAYNRSLGPIGQVRVQTTPEGPTMMAPASIADPTLAARYAEAMKLVPAPGGGGKGKPPATAPGTATSTQETKPAEPQPTTAEPPPKKGPPTASEMGKPQASADVNPNLAASTDNDFLLRRMMQEREAAGLGGAAPQGTPSGMMFLNPATGSYEPLQTGPPPAQAQPAAQPQQGGSMWSRPTPIAPPPAPTAAQPQTNQPGNMLLQGSQPPSQAAGAIQQATQQPGVALADWQAQNAHPVASSADAVNWAKGFDTRTQDATYLPHGGPNAEPAYAFHLKGGSTNIVPISQMVKNGFGPSVAGQNTSAILSASDALSNPPPGQPPGQPPTAPGMTLGATAQPPGGVGSFGQPPAAPGMTDIQGNPLSAYTNVQSQGGPSLADLTAQTAAAGVPARPGEPAPGQPIHPTADTSLSQADKDAVQAQVDKMPPPSGKYTGDSIVPGTTGPYTYYRNDNPASPDRGRVYTVLPGPAGGYFNVQRWYLGTNKYDTYELPDSAMKQTMWEKWGTNGHLSRSEIDAMSPEEMKPWLQRAWQNENFTRSSPTEGINSDLDSLEQLHNYLKKIGDLEQTLAANGYPNLSVDHKMVAAAKNASMSLGQRHLSEIAGVDQMDAVSASTIRTLEQTINQTTDFLKDHPKLLLNPGQGGGQQTPNLDIGNWVRLGLPDIPATNILQDSGFSGQNINTKMRMIGGLQKLADDRYKDLTDQAQTQWMRIAPKHDANMIKLDQGRDFNDPTNFYKQHLHTIDNKDDYLEFAQNHPDTKFLGPDNQIRQTPHKPPTE